MNNLFWSALEAIALPVSLAVSLAGLAGLAGLLVRVCRRHRREQQEIAARLAEQMPAPAAICFECRRCHHVYWYRSIRGEICLNCWCELTTYLRQVAG